MIRIFLVAWIVLGAVALAGEPVAVVNGEPISQEELDRATGLAEIVFTLSQQFPVFAQFPTPHRRGEGIPRPLRAGCTGEARPTANPAPRSEQARPRRR